MTVRFSALSSSGYMTPLTDILSRKIIGGYVALGLITDELPWQTPKIASLLVSPLALKD
jgi:hypothetical protein